MAMNPTSSAATSSGNIDPTLRVSLGGGPQPPVRAAASHDSLSAALDDAVNQLSEVTHPQPASSAHADAARSPKLFALIESMSMAGSRRDAADLLVEFLASQCPSCSVRCAIGKGRITHMLDSRLGWLGPESFLYQKASAEWQAPRRREDDAPIDQAGIFGDKDRRQIVLPQSNGTGRCVVWLEKESDRATTEFDQTLAALSPAIGVFGSVLWGRPLRSWPALVVGMAKRTSMSLAMGMFVLLGLAVFPVRYPVACTARVETMGQRMVSAPFEATLLSAHVKPGDAVKQGDLLVQLDGRPLRLEREAIEAEIGKISKEHDVALATRRIAEAQQAALKRRQLQRQSDLLDDRLGRLEVTSPIDGIIVSGDLEKFVGVPLERGQTLLEVAPMEAMIIEVEIPEHEIGYVQESADVRVKIDAIGGKSIRMPLDELFPSAELRDDQNVFVGQIRIHNAEQKLLPGMRGEATTYGPLRPWIWSWVRGGIERTLWWIGY